MEFHDINTGFPYTETESFMDFFEGLGHGHVPVQYVDPGQRVSKMSYLVFMILVMIWYNMKCLGFMLSSAMLPLPVQIFAAGQLPTNVLTPATLQQPIENIWESVSRDAIYWDSLYV